MDERRPDDGDVLDEGAGQVPDSASAGPANTPSFEHRPTAQDAEAEAGRPPSHREFQETSEPGPRAGDPFAAIAPASAADQDRLRGRAQDAAKAAGESAADAFDRAGDPIDGAATGGGSTWRESDGGGSARSAREDARSAQGWGERAASAGGAAAEYLREAEFDDLRGALERQVRERPLQTLLVAAAAGWLIGKLLR